MEFCININLNMDVMKWLKALATYVCQQIA